MQMYTFSCKKRDNSGRMLMQDAAKHAQTLNQPSEGMLRAEDPKAVSPVQAKRRTGDIVSERA